MNTTIRSSSPASATAAARGSATARDPAAEEYRRGRGDGIVWARDYATADELRDLVDNFEPGRGGRFDIEHSLCEFTSDRRHASTISVTHHDNPFWRGFAAGAEEVLDAGLSPRET
jgi:hypothetical protein